VDADVVELPSRAMAVLVRLALNVVTEPKEILAIHPMTYQYRFRNRTFFTL